MMGSNVRHDKPLLTNYLSAYLLHHLQSLVFSLKKIYQTPVTTMMTIAVISITLSLPSGFYIFLKNIDTISGDLHSTTQITLYLRLNINEKTAQRVQQTIKAMPQVQSTTFISRQQAFETFRTSSGFGASIDVLSDNPLPHSIIVQPTLDSDRFIIKNLLNTLKIMPEVAIAKMDTEWLERLYTLLAIAQRVIAIITTLFAIAIVLIIGNTIRLDIQSRYQEIIVTRLIGATNAFIRRPFLYGGLWYGLLGGISAWVIVELSYLAISSPLNHLGLLYQKTLVFITFSIWDVILLLSLSTLLGLVGSWFAVDRHLRQIDADITLR